MVGIHGDGMIVLGLYVLHMEGSRNSSEAPSQCKWGIARVRTPSLPLATLPLIPTPNPTHARTLGGTGQALGVSGE